MIIENLTTLKINKLTKAQYEAALAAGTVSENELYMTEETNVDLTDLANHILITIPAGRMRGDIDGDGKFTQNDADTLLKHVNKQEILTDPTQLLCCDVDSSGAVNVVDVAACRNLITGKTKAGEYTEITGNWTNNPNYATEEGQFYTDIPITGMTANHSASVIVKGTYESGIFPKAECVEGAIRIYAKLCPISALTAVVSWGSGNGTAVIATESIDVSLDTLGAASKPTITTATLLASNWDSTAKTYSFEADYPSANYDIEVALDSTATAEQAEAFNGAQIVGSATSNIIKAYGDVPTLDIPVIVKVVTK